MRKPRSLRARLVLIVVCLMASVGVVVGALSVLLFNSYLVAQLDDSLRQSAGRTSGSYGPLPGFDSQGSGQAPDYGAPGQASGTISGVIVDNILIRAGYPDAYGENQILDRGQLTRLATVPLDGQPHTVYLGRDLGDYRVISTAVRGTENVVLLTALPLKDVHTLTGQLALVFALVTAAGIALAAAVATFVVDVALRPLHRVASAAATVADLPLDRGDVDIDVRVPDEDTDTRTEVGQVGSALNRLLSHVGTALAVRQRSEDKVRQFVADASHELRTPLASIRGYSELTRRMDDTLSPQVEHNLGRIESEAMRMTSLVEDLLLLARLDSQRELRQEDVDLSLIALEAVGDAHVAGPEHVWLLDLPEDPVVVTGDDPRLRQVLVNLLGNARTHTPPGTTITTSLEVVQDQVVLRVADDGPGIDPSLRASLFERFTRGDNSRTRATGSTGLGLSIVKAVVDAHGGSVAVSSEPGDTVFIVRLPLGHQTAQIGSA
ncbi:cell wall metabolism sensor histidine kinase WalK [Herbiconiux sp. L3-i23]|uniref:sensor histidine kinase n=1 Tax=Herbiconiux sp. L3-i23 TaxID=2905871 RepID=UPI00204B562C|nr:HAMP domain-containing sensor histidine kinase [Herbiconiux sp. L3-i23]BDI21403.1 two-component sensor histidine kinase [Herbiconiux sp. L3-i23]